MSEFVLIKDALGSAELQKVHWNRQTVFTYDFISTHFCVHNEFHSVYFNESHQSVTHPLACNENSLVKRQQKIIFLISIHQICNQLYVSTTTLSQHYPHPKIWSKTQLLSVTKNTIQPTWLQAISDQLVTERPAQTALIEFPIERGKSFQCGKIV